jgi:hypothetical protein
MGCLEEIESQEGAFDVENDVVTKPRNGVEENCRFTLLIILKNAKSYFETN